jgi:AAA15 family ATPase/GTPase
MHISRFSVKNYKSFNQASELEFTTGINIITGQNNAGKTALLEALSSKFLHIPHKSTKTLPTSRLSHETNSEVVLEFSIQSEVFEDYIFNEGTVQMPILLNQAAWDFDYSKFIEIYFGNQINIKAQLLNGNLHVASFILSKQLEPSSGINIFVPNKQTKKLKFSKNHISNPDSSTSIANKMLSQIYCFKAERLKITSSGFGVNQVLSPDASNLPEVLNILQGDTIRFERYNSYIRRVFPQIYQINIRPIGSSTCEIVVSNEDPKLMRNDLVIPLAACGTGIGQVLAILYVVLTSDSPRIIIIDEPNSFLHPGAARKLIEILKEHPQPLVAS